ncbi:MAG TPA: hypothetical protein VGN81_21950 [Pseudonocardiaceae bacterium]|jgi:hypothetical protein
MTRERHYQRLLRLYPKDYRETYGAELVDTLIATNRSPYVESLNLVGGAIVARTRRLRPATAPWQDALAITSLLAPLLLLAGATDGLHEAAWFTATHGSLTDIFYATKDALIWLPWVIVLVLGLFRLRRTAMVGSWIAAAAIVVILNGPGPGFQMATEIGAGCWSLLALLAAIACTTSNGIRRGYELVGRNRTILVAAAVLLALGTRTLGHNYVRTYWIALAIALLCVAYAAWRDKAVGKRVITLFVTPFFAIGSTVWLRHGASFRFGFVLPHIVYEYAPPLVVLILITLAWRVRTRRFTARPALPQDPPADL